MKNTNTPLRLVLQLFHANFVNSSTNQRRCLRWWLAVFAACSCFAPTLTAQNVQYNNPAVDLGLRSTQRVNPSTHGVEFQIPLGHYRGRAGHDIPVTLSYSSKLWSIDFEGYNPGAPPPHGGIQPFTIVVAKYANRSIAGWTSSVGFPLIDTFVGNQIYDSFGNPNVTGNCTTGCFLIDRLMVWMPDGAGHELRASDQPRSHLVAPADEYYSVDGTRMRYQKSTQTLFMPDGSRYLISAGKHVDRNGNTLTWTGSYRDTVDRQINSPLPGSAPLSPGDQSYSLPGADNVPLNYTLKWRNLSDVLTTPQALRFIADSACPPGTNSFTPTLFVSDLNSRTCIGNAGVLFNPVVLSQIVLPNQQTYTFTYDIYGAIDKVVLPGGAYEKYQYAQRPPLSSPITFKPVYGQANRNVVKHIVSPSGLAADETDWDYSSSGNLMSMTAPDGTRTDTFLWTDGTGRWGYSNNSSRAGRAFDERIYSVTGQMIRRRLTEWVMTPSNASTNFDGADAANRNPRISREVEILLDTSGPGMARTKTYSYDTTFQYNVGIEQTAVSEFDFVEVDHTTAETLPISSLSSIPNGTLLRTTETDYLTGDINYRSRHLLGLPTAIRTKNGQGVVVAQTSNVYDEAAFPLLTYASVFGWTDPATNFRGNVTTISRWLNFNGTTLSVFPAGNYLLIRSQYDQCGSVRKVWDAKDTTLSNPTLIDYSSLHHRAYPTTQTSPDPDGGGPLVALTTSTEYDNSTGLVTATVDANSQRTTFAYNDPLNRLKQTIRAATDAVAKNQTTYTYDDISHTITATSDLHVFNDNILKMVTLYDGMGRLKETQQYESAISYIAQRQEYDPQGRQNKTSNPFRPAQESPLWTTQTFDGLGRSLTVMTPDNAVVSTAYSANTTTVTDQTGKQRKNVTDALDRLVKVFEAPNVAGFNFETSYTYDAVNNQTLVTQDIQTRRFLYDSLRRLIRSRIPEHLTNGSLSLGGNSWSVGYQYDNNSNVTQRTDARGVVTSYVYDALNRNTGVTYTNDPAGTPAITYSFDAATNGKGQLYQAQTANGSLTTIDAYDALGRPTTQRQQFFVSGAWSTPYIVQRTYKPGGVVGTQTYPSNRTVSFNYDDAGRLITFAGTLGDGASRTYSNEVLYSPFGGIAKEKFGTTTAVYNKLFYNNRGQLAEIRESTSYTGPTDMDANRGAIVNHYSDQCAGMCTPTSSMTDNNGNLRKQEIHIPNAQMRWQQYDYDPLNRLLWVREVLNGGAEQWKQQFIYDRWGNRRIDAGITYGSGINEKAFDVNQNTNQLTVPAGQSGAMTYDSAGNLANDTYTGAGNRTYDGENRMVSAFGGLNQTQLYSYNPSGQRFKRKVNGVETWQVYGFNGELLAEYPASGAVGAPSKEYGYRNNQLLVVSDSNGVPITPVFSDDFNDNSINTTKWSLYDPVSPAVVSEQGQRIQIALVPNVATYNGVMSVNTFNLSGMMAQVEVPQAVSQAGFTENQFSIQLNAQNQFLINVGSGSLLFRSRVNGVNDQTSVPYNPGVHMHWRIRHDQATNTIKFETSGNGTAWSTQKSVTPGFTLNGLRMFLTAGAWSSGNANPGTAKYDNFKLISSQAAHTTLPITNSGFETPVIGAGQFQAGPSGATWSITGGAGISGNGSGFTSGNSVAPEGVQVGYLQGGEAVIQQNVSGFQAGVSYSIVFAASQRGNCCNAGGMDFRVYIDNTLLATFHPSGSTYLDYETPVFNVTAGTHTVKFAGLNSLGGDHSAFIDNVRITGVANGGTGIQWLVKDQLGTPRMILDQSGQLANIKRHDYLPFGEELFAGMGGRTQTEGYSGLDGVRQQFTSKERDAETQLDYFLARYYSPVQGRFTSVDPQNSGAFAPDPQSWNGYAYARNNPLKYTDPDGKAFKICDLEARCVIISDEEAKKYTFNKQYQRDNGYSTKGDGKIYGSDGNVIGTYTNLGCDCWSDQQNRMVNGIADELGNASTYLFGAAGAIGRSKLRPTKPVNLPSSRNVLVDMDEVATGHMKGGARAAQSAADGKGKSMFPDWMTKPQVESAITDAYEHSKVTHVQGTRVMLEGVTKDGTIIEMWFNRETKIIETAYPIGRTSWGANWK
jgi:RHS repeat-associated protein